MNSRNLRRLDVTEADTLRVITDFLDLQQAQGKLLYIRHNPSTVISKVVKGKIKTAFKKVRESQLGVADLIVFRKIKERLAPSGDFIFCLDVLCIEVKSAKGNLSPAQVRWETNARVQGIRCIVARSLEDVMEALR